MGHYEEIEDCRLGWQFLNDKISCHQKLCHPIQSDMPACDTDKHECVADENGVKWRPIILQHRSNGGIPLNQYDCLVNNYDSCTYGADPPVEGADFINLKDFESYQIDGKYHMKMVWSYGESVEWKQGPVFICEPLESVRQCLQV